MKKRYSDISVVDLLENAKLGVLKYMHLNIEWKTKKNSHKLEKKIDTASVIVY